MRSFIVFGLLSLLACSISRAQEGAGTAAPEKSSFGTTLAVPNAGTSAQETAQPELIKVYALKFIKSSEALALLEQLCPRVLYAENAKLNLLVVRATDNEHQEIARLVELVDSQGENTETKIIQGNAKELAASGKIVGQLAEKSGVTLAFDQEFGIAIIKGPSAEVEHVSELIREVSAASKDNTAKRLISPKPYAIRVLWLSNDPVEDNRNSFKADTAIENSVAKLATLGFANMKVKMQLVGRCDLINGNADCQVEGANSIGNTRRTLDIQATLRGGGADPICAEFKIDASATDQGNPQSPTARNRIGVEIHLQPQKYYLLAASPHDEFQSAFIVQLIEDF